MREEGLCYSHCGGVVGEEFLVEDIQINVDGLGEVECTLNPSVDEDAVQVWVFGDDFRGELGDLPSSTVSCTLLGGTMAYGIPHRSS